MDKNQTQIAILVDGNNFYKGLESSNLRSRFNLNLFDYDKLAAFVAAGRPIAEKRYYKGVVRKEIGNEKSQRMVSEQQRIFSRLENAGWQVRRGMMSKNTEFGQCEGFYFYNQKIENKEHLKLLSEEILREHKFHYKPIVIISQNVSNYQFLLKDLDDIKDDGKGLKRIDGIYFALNRWREKGVDVNIAIDMLGLS